MSDAARAIVLSVRQNCLDEKHEQGHALVCYECSGSAVKALITMRTAALRAHVRKILVGPFGGAMCCCRNVNAVKAGMESPCWYCEARALLADAEGKS